MSAKAVNLSQKVTAKCVVCQKKFKPQRRDARYCSPACRQRSHRSRANLEDLDHEIEAARLHYWKLIAQKAHALGRSMADTMADESQYVDLEGNVFQGSIFNRGGWRWIGKVRQGRAARAGFNSWGLEAAGPPWCPPSGQRAFFEGAILGPRRKAKPSRNVTAVAL
jgi:hypothetical protein